VAPGRVGPLLGKRVFGWLSWRARRGSIHRTEVLEALLEELTAAAPDQIVITGDLTNVSLEEEFVAALDWLRRIGDPQRVTAIPGNHDAYVPVPRARSWDLWAEYLVSDSAGRALLAGGLEPGPGEIEFPSVRIREPVAIVGICSAVPTPPFFASGAVGVRQLERVERALTELAATDLLRVVLIHHPPDPRATSARRGLRDARALCSVLRRAGAELVLHGHLHRGHRGWLEGPLGPIPVLGASSASDAGVRRHKRANYHLLDVEPLDREGGRRQFRLTLRARTWDAGAARFVADGREQGVPLGPA
jgi:3',5'-cyclic AMP phosphodiesterase CpdA